MYQFQTYYRDKCRQFYVTAECEEYSKVVEYIVTNISTLFGVVFQIQYFNDENEWITLSENADDIRDMFRCARNVESADFRRIKIKIVEGCSPAPAACVDSRTADTDDTPPLKRNPNRKRLRFDSDTNLPVVDLDGNDTDYPLSAYKSPIDLDIQQKKNEIQCMEEKLSYYDEQYDQISKQYTVSGRSTKQGAKQCGKCHLYQGHRKNNCPNDVCVSAIMCGDVSKHMEENNELRELAEKKHKLTADLRKERQELELKIKCADKINSSFAKRIESHLIDSNRKKYLVQTAFGVKPRQALLNEHISILEKHYKGNIPVDIVYEKSRFASIIERGLAPFPKRPENSVRELLTTNTTYGVRFPTIQPPSGTCTKTTESTPQPPAYPPQLPSSPPLPCDVSPYTVPFSSYWPWYGYPGYTSYSSPGLSPWISPPDYKDKDTQHEQSQTSAEKTSASDA